MLSIPIPRYMNEMIFMSKMLTILKDRKARLIGLLAGTGFLLFYLYSIGNLTNAGIPISFSFQVARNWPDKVFKTIAPFLWEPIAVLYLIRGWAFFISIPNLLIAFSLSVFLSLNISIAVFTYSLPKVCRPKSSLKGIAGVLPSFLVGFACCVPTFLIALGSAVASFTVFFSQIRPFLIPASIALMIWGLVSSLKRISEEHLKISREQRKEGKRNDIVDINLKIPRDK